MSLHEMHLHLNASPSRIDQIKEETAKDEVLFSLCSVIIQSWPNTRSECPADLYAFWNYWDELTHIPIPKTLKTDVLQHNCTTHTKSSIKEMVKACAPCQRNQLKRAPHASQHPTETMAHTWTYSFGTTHPICCYLTITASFPWCEN